MTTSYPGIDYSLNQANKNFNTGIRYGVIHQNSVGQAWFDESEPYYGEFEVECSECGELYLVTDFEDIECSCGKTIYLCDMDIDPISYIVDDEKYKAECSDGDIFVIKSPYFTYAQFCSPCAPGACYLMNPLDEPVENNKCYCLGHDWFDNGKAPYPIYNVKTGELVKPK